MALFLFVTLAASAAVYALWHSALLRDHFVMEAIAQPAPSPDHFLSITGFSAVDSLIYMHQLEDVCPSIRAADVLFFGDSRLQFAFRTGALERFFSDWGLRYYLLGFPFGSDVLAHEILDTCDVKARLVVVQEATYLTGKARQFDRLGLDSSYFEALRHRFEFEMAYATRRILHRWFPHPVANDLAGGSWILYRSRLNGSWWVAAGITGSVPVAEITESKRVRLPKEHLKAARRFKAEVQRRGGDLAIVYVPSTSPSRDRAHTIAEYLDVPFLDPRVENLVTEDGVHLQVESADRFAIEVLRQLEPLLP